MKRLSILSAVMATALYGMAADKAKPPLRSAEQVVSLAEDEFALGREFQLSGTVVCIGDERGFLLDDGSSGIYLICWNRSGVKPGDTVVVNGQTELDECGQRIYRTHLLVRTGTVDVPPPIDADPGLLVRGGYEFRLVRISGRIIDIFRDEIDHAWNYIVLKCGTEIIYASFHDRSISPDSLTPLVDAYVRITGVCLPSYSGCRRFIGPRLGIPGFAFIEILKPAPADPYESPILEDAERLPSRTIAEMGRRRVQGEVIATWSGNRYLLKVSDRRILRVTLASGSELPSCGDVVIAVGFPETDFFRINLSRAVNRIDGKAPPSESYPKKISIRQVLYDKSGNRQIDTEYFGKLVRINGNVLRLDPDRKEKNVFCLECEGHLVQIRNIASDDIPPGSVVEVSGICLLETNDWKPESPFPRITGVSIVTRTPKDVKLLSRPPWWTPKRLMIVIGALIAALTGIFIWNCVLNRIVERRSRELLKEQIARAGASLKVDERTRLAVELHDSLSQTLTGVSFQIDAAELARRKDPSRIEKHLNIAKRTLQSCREELRNCLWDLRNNALEEKDAKVAIRKTVEPHIGETELAVDFKVPRNRLSDNTFHSILCIIRELAVNAVRHGKAEHVAVSGGTAGRTLEISVADDGSGFDPLRRLGVDEGHFGLLGVAERVDALEGKLEINSIPGRGTTVKVSIRT